MNVHELYSTDGGEYVCLAQNYLIEKTVEVLSLNVTVLGEPAVKTFHGVQNIYVTYTCVCYSVHTHLRNIHICMLL